MDDQDLQDAMAQSGALAAAVARKNAATTRSRVSGVPRRLPIAQTETTRLQPEIDMCQAEIKRLRDIINSLDESFEKLEAKNLRLSEELSRRVIMPQPRVLIPAYRIEETHRPQDLARIAQLEEELANRDAIIAALFENQPSARPAPAAAARPAPAARSVHFAAFSSSMEVTRETTIRGGVTSSSTTRVVRRFP